MSGPRNICFTFVGDCTRDSRLTRFVETLAGEHTVSVIALASGERAFTYAGAAVREFSHGGFPLRASLRRFWRAGKEAAVASGADCFVAADLYSLPLASGAAARRDALLVYDSRELYSSIASLQRRPFTQLYWTLAEKRHARKAACILTVNDSLRAILQRSFPAVPIHVFRNVSRVPDKIDRVDLRSLLNIPHGKAILLALGGLQEGRGLLLCVEALAALPDCVLICLGSGDLRERVRAAAEERGVGERVRIVDPVASRDVIRYAAAADIGMCVIENLGRSYHLSLPNKLFEYIAAGVPVVGSDFPEIAAVVRDAGVGVVCNPDATGVTGAVNRLLQDRTLYQSCKANCAAAASGYAWQVEESRFLSVFEHLISP